MPGGSAGVAAEHWRSVTFDATVITCDSRGVLTVRMPDASCLQQTDSTELASDPQLCDSAVVPEGCDALN